MQELNMEKNKVESVKIEQDQMNAVLHSKFEKLENDEKQLNNLKMEVENKLSIMGKKERENQLATEDLSLKTQQLRNATKRQQEYEKELKIQQHQIDHEHEKLKKIIEKKV